MSLSIHTDVAVIGAGTAGLTALSELRRLGFSALLIDHGPLGTTCARVVGAHAIERFSKEMTMWLGQPLEATPDNQGVELRSGNHTAQVDLVLAALGRHPNTDGLELKLADVPHDTHGRPVIDTQTLRAGSSAVFFAGDASHLRPLMHEAVDEGIIAARAAAQALDDHERALPPRRTPLAIVFSDPDIATIGQSYEALDLDHTIIGSAQGDGNGRSRVLGAEDNLVRIYADRSDGRLLGACLIATRGEHLAHLLAWAIQRGDTIDDLLMLPYYHPSIEEMLQTALKDASQQLQAIHK